MYIFLVLSEIKNETLNKKEARRKLGFVETWRWLHHAVGDLPPQKTRFRPGSPAVVTRVAAGRRLVAQGPHPSRGTAARDPGLASLPAGAGSAHAAGVTPHQNRRALQKNTEVRLAKHPTPTRD